MKHHYVPPEKKAAYTGVGQNNRNTTDSVNFFQYSVGPPLPSIQLQSSLQWTHTSFEQSLVEFYTILLKEHLQVALDILDVGICSTL
jgi:hypothetical protein